MTRLAGVLVAVLLAALPLTARANFWLNGFGMYDLISAHCDLDTNSKAAVLNCEPEGSWFGMNDGWQKIVVVTRDGRYQCVIDYHKGENRAYGGPAWEAKLAPGSSRSCSLKWANENTLDVRV